MLMPDVSFRRLLLDTDIIIALFAQDVGVLQKLQQAPSYFLPCVVLGELYYGARKSGRVQANVQRVEDFAYQNSILDCDAETAYHYGLIREALRAKGKPIPENDIWIVALALQHDLVLVSRDAHFNEIDGLSIVVW